MMYDLKHRFYTDIANKILYNKGIVYGGYVRDMILYKQDQDKDIPIDQRTYPNDIDIIIDKNNKNKLLNELKNHYKIEVKNNNNNSYPINNINNIIYKTTKIIVSDEHNNNINIDCIFILCTNDKFMENVELYFKSNPIDFRINRLAYLNNNMHVHYINENGNFKIESLIYINYVKKKIARCHHETISEHKLPIFTKRIIKMLSKGFLVVTNNKRNKIIINKNETDNLPTCIICLEDIKDTLIYQQNGCSNTCIVNCHYSCLNDKNNTDIYNKCSICRKAFDMFKYETVIQNEDSKY